MRHVALLQFLKCGEQGPGLTSLVAAPFNLGDDLDLPGNVLLAESNVLFGSLEATLQCVPVHTGDGNA